MKSEKDQRQQAVELALGQIEKRYGKGSVMRLGDASLNDVHSISTGSLAVDIATGIGGLPRARIVEVFGPESSGKTTLTLHAVANVQARGGMAAFIDAEHALDPEYAKNLGVNTDQLLVSQPDDGEQALEIAEVLVRSGAVDVLVVDSVAALVPRAEIEGEMGDSHVGLQARLMSQAMRKLAGVAKRTDCCLIFINQIREKIGVMFGSPETTPGGRALKFYSSMRLDIRRIGALKDGDRVIGNRTRVKVVKNKCAPPFRQAELDILYGEGMSLESDLIDLGLVHGLVSKTGSWFSLGETRIGQGKENSRKFLKENPELARKLEKDIRAAAGILREDVTSPDGPAGSKDSGKNPSAPTDKSAASTSKPTATTASKATSKPAATTRANGKDSTRKSTASSPAAGTARKTTNRAAPAARDTPARRGSRAPSARSAAR